MNVQVARAASRSTAEEAAEAGFSRRGTKFEAGIREALPSAVGKAARKWWLKERQPPEGGSNLTCHEFDMQEEDSRLEGRDRLPDEGSHGYSARHDDEMPARAWTRGVEIAASGNMASTSHFVLERFRNEVKGTGRSSRPPKTRGLRRRAADVAEGKGRT